MEKKLSSAELVKQLERDIKRRDFEIASLRKEVRVCHATIVRLTTAQDRRIAETKPK